MTPAQEVVGRAVRLVEIARDDGPFAAFVESCAMDVSDAMRAARSSDRTAPTTPDVVTIVRAPR